MATRTIPVSGNGTGTLTFQNPGPDVLDIESVLALIDTGGTGPTTATLTVTSPAGNDVAAVPQGQPIAGGGQGRATWALRLAEDASAAPPPPAAAQYEAIIDGTGVLVAPNVNTSLPWFKDFGDSLLGNIGGAHPTIITAGTYAITVYVAGGVALASYDLDAAFRIPNAGPTFQSFGQTVRWVSGLSSGSGPIIAVTRPLAAGDSLEVVVKHNSAGNVRLFLTGAVAKLP